MLLVEVTVKIISESESCSAMSDCLLPHGLYSPWNSPGQNNGVANRSLLQGIFRTHGLNPHLTVQADSLPAEPPGKPKVVSTPYQVIGT